MLDEISTPENAAPAETLENGAGMEAPADASAAQVDRVTRLIAAQRRPAGADAPASTSAAPAAPVKRGRGRPRNDATSGENPTAQKKRASGKKPTRAELAAKLKEMQDARGAASPAGAAPGASTTSAPEPSPLHRPEVKARFAAGVSKGAQQAGRFLAARRGAHWAIERLEADALGESSADALLCVEELAPSLGPYIGKAVAFAPLLIFAGVLWGILIDRMERDAEIAAGRATKVMPATGPVRVVEMAR